MAPVAPGLFSTTTGCPRYFDMPWPTARMITSGLCPEPQGMMILIGLLGNSCATDAVAATDNAAHRKMARKKFIGDMSCPLSRIGRTDGASVRSAQNEAIAWDPHAAAKYFRWPPMQGPCYCISESTVTIKIPDRITTVTRMR